jgi:hypothetical protein
MVADGRVSQNWASKHTLPNMPTFLPFVTGSGGAGGSGRVRNTVAATVVTGSSNDPVNQIQQQPMQEDQPNLPAVTTPSRAARRQVPATAPQPSRVQPPSAAELALLQHFCELQADRRDSLMEMLAEARRDEQKAVLENRILGRENKRLRKELGER